MYIQEKVKDINERLKILAHISEIVIWGAGLHTSKMLEKTELLSYDIRDIVDIDEVKWGNYFFGFDIKSPYDMDWHSVGAVVISACGVESQIMDCLTNMLGYEGNVITLYGKGECTPFYLLYDENVSQVCYLDDYDNWSDADNMCSGYGDSHILDTVASAMEKVLNGKAAWERDGCLFHEQKFSYPICAAILRCSVQNGNQGVRILDIGGALGSTYIQNKKYLVGIENLEYIVAEQEHFADYGHRYLENAVLHFIDSAEDYKNLGKIDIVLMSGSLQYIASYKDVIARIKDADPHYIILDRFLVSNRLRICREVVPESIYKGSMPVRIFSESEIFSLFLPEFQMIEKDVSSLPEAAYFPDGRADAKFYVFEKVHEVDK